MAGPVFNMRITYSNVMKFSTNAQVGSNIAEALQGIARDLASNPESGIYFGGILTTKADFAEWLRQNPQVLAKIPPGLRNKLEEYGGAVNNLYRILNKTPDADANGADPLPPTPQQSVDPPAGGGVVT